MTTTNPDDSITTAMDGSNQMLHKPLWNVSPLMLQSWKCLGWWIPPSLTLIQYIPSMFNWVLFWRMECLDVLLLHTFLTKTCNLWSGIGIPLLTCMCRMTWCCRIACTCTRNILPPWWMFFLHNNIATSKNGRLVARSLEYNVPLNLCRNVFVYQHLTGEDETHLRTHQSISPSAGTTADVPLSDIPQSITNCLVGNSA